MSKLPDNENWKEWTLDKLQDINKEIKETEEMNQGMVNAISETFSKLGIDKITFGKNEDMVIDTKCKVVKFPNKKK